MRFIVSLLAIALTLPLAAIAATTPSKGDLAEYRRIIETRCTVCHTADRIEKAMQDKRNASEILEKMIRMGAQLDENEKSVLGTFWGSPLKE